MCPPAAANLIAAPDRATGAAKTGGITSQFLRGCEVNGVFAARLCRTLRSLGPAAAG